MAHRISKISAICTAGALLTLLFITGCPGHRYLAGGEETRTFTILEAEFDGAFSKAIQTAAEIDFHVSNFSRSSGTIHARRGAGFTEVTEMDIFIEKQAPGKLLLVITIKSSKDHDMFIKEFIEAYSKYVKLNPQPEPTAPTQ
jgi:hypothetical protein